MAYILSALDQIPTINKNSRVLFPGVGNSSIARKLFDKGYKNIVVSDLELAAIEEQRRHFSNIKGGAPKSVVFLDADALVDPKPFSEGTFDLVVDKSFLDVFHTTGGSRTVQKKIFDCLSPGGVVLVISIYHLKWRGMFPRGSGWVVKYGSVSRPRFCSKRTSVQQLSNPICLLLAGTGLAAKSVQAVSEIEDTKVKTFHGMSEWEFPLLEAGSM